MVGEEESQAGVSLIRLMEKETWGSRKSRLPHFKTFFIKSQEHEKCCLASLI